LGLLFLLEKDAHLVLINLYHSTGERKTCGNVRVNVPKGLSLVGVNRDRQTARTTDPVPSVQRAWVVRSLARICIFTCDSSPIPMPEKPATSRDFPSDQAPRRFRSDGNRPSFKEATMNLVVHPFFNYFSWNKTNSQVEGIQVFL
jgi:hypothetical protein